MKRPTKQLLDDLLQDAVAPEFRDRLMDETLRHARRRKYLRRANAIIGVTAVMGILAFTFWKNLGTALVSNQIHHPDLNAVPLQQSDLVQIVNTSHDFAPTVVQTGMLGPSCKEIDDGQFLSFLPDKQLALIRIGPHQTQVVFSNPNDESEYLVQ
jgi:hypothetical protein